MERIPLKISQVDDPAQIVVGIDDFGQALEFGVLLHGIRHIGDKREAKAVWRATVAAWCGRAAYHCKKKR